MWMVYIYLSIYLSIDIYIYIPWRRARSQAPYPPTNRAREWYVGSHAVAAAARWTRVGCPVRYKEKSGLTRGM